eukprot:GILK01010580.1.p2 GENE.GILK01010580.1~~GILK01010580.1.p2  ORF type:complete len:604 (-),score=45.41 GILK01010580.1:190-2001(-)
MHALEFGVDVLHVVEGLSLNLYHHLLHDMPKEHQDLTREKVQSLLHKHPNLQEDVTCTDFRLLFALHHIFFAPEKFNEKEMADIARLWAEIVHLCYQDEPARTSHSVLRMYIYVFKFTELLKIHFPLMKCSLCSKRPSGRCSLYTVKFHLLSVHIPDMYRFVCLRRIATDRFEAMFRPLRQALLYGSRHSRQSTIWNAVVQVLMAEKHKEMWGNAKGLACSRQSSKVSKAWALRCLPAVHERLDSRFLKNQGAIDNLLYCIRDYRSVGYVYHPVGNFYLFRCGEQDTASQAAGHWPPPFDLILHRIADYNHLVDTYCETHNVQTFTSIISGSLDNITLRDDSSLLLSWPAMPDIIPEDLCKESDSGASVSEMEDDESLEHGSSSLPTANFIGQQFEIEQHGLFFSTVVTRRDGDMYTVELEDGREECYSEQELRSMIETSAKGQALKYLRDEIWFVSPKGRIYHYCSCPCVEEDSKRYKAVRSDAVKQRRLSPCKRCVHFGDRHREAIRLPLNDFNDKTETQLLTLQRSCVAVIRAAEDQFLYEHKRAITEADLATGIGSALRREHLEYIRITTALQLRQAEQQDAEGNHLEPQAHGMSGIQT